MFVMFSEIALGDYIEGFEVIGPNKTLRKIRGWVYGITKNSKTDNIDYYYVRADDDLYCSRGKNISTHYVDVIKLPRKEQP